ncbi:MAG: hypothetical protein JSS53_10080 [Proteobacteria bacterium]|nr:hypothetical protein [Pseudomonadota bacterium]
MKINHIVVASLIALSLSGCNKLVGDDGLVHNRENDYLVSKNGKDLEIPPNLNGDRISKHYYVPEHHGTVMTSTVPPGSLAAKTGEGMIHGKHPALNNSAFSMGVSQDKSPILVVNIPSTEAWSAVGSGLYRQGIRVVGVNEDEKVYVFLDTYATDDKVNRLTPVYEMHIGASEGKSLVWVTGMGGKPTYPGVSTRLLKMVQSGMEGKSNLTLMQWLGRQFK